MDDDDQVDEDHVLHYRIDLGSYLTIRWHDECYIRQADLLAGLDKVLMTLVDVKASDHQVAQQLQLFFQGQIDVVVAIQKQLEGNASSVIDPFTVSTKKNLWRRFLDGVFRRRGR